MLDKRLRSMVTDGTLTAAEYTRLAIPAWYRTESEWRAPFDGVPMLLRSYDEVMLGDPLWAIVGPGSAAGSLTHYATAVAAAIRVSFGPALLAALDAGRRSAVETELFETRYPTAIVGRGASLFAWRLAVLCVQAPTAA